MREYLFTSLILFFVSPLNAQVVPERWQIIKDTRGACQVSVPPDWILYGESKSSAVLRDSATAMVIVTSQPGQDFRPMPAGLIKALDISAERLFENSASRVFFADTKPEHPGEPYSYSFSVPAKGGTCSGHLTFQPSVTEEVAKRIAMSLASTVSSSN